MCVVTQTVERVALGTRAQLDKIEDRLNHLARAEKISGECLTAFRVNLQFARNELKLLDGKDK